MNNKIKRANKIMMMTVAILLCFVLISTSVVSGIYAKYVITKSAETTVKLKAFGVTLTVTGSNGATVTPSGSTGANVVKVTISDLQMTPGQTLADVVKFTIDGTPSVSQVKLKIKTTVSGSANFNTTSAKITALVPDTTGLAITTANYIPFGFTMKTSANLDGTSPTSKTLLGAWSTPTSDTAFATSIRDKINSEFTFSTTDSTTDTAEKIIYQNSAYNTKYVSFGFTCWGKGTSGLPSNVTETEADLIQMYLQSQSSAKLTITYTVSVEQVV